MKTIKTINQKLVAEQIERYDKMGRWTVRQIGRLPHPLLVAQKDGYKEIKSGTINGLIWKNEHRYTDIRHGCWVALAYTGEQQQQVEALLNRELRDLVDVPFVVAWNEDGEPYIVTSPNTVFEKEQA